MAMGISFGVCNSSTISCVNINNSFTGDLNSKKRHKEAGHVLLDYAEDVRGP